MTYIIPFCYFNRDTINKYFLSFEEASSNKECGCEANSYPINVQLNSVVTKTLDTNEQFLMFTTPSLVRVALDL